MSKTIFRNLFSVIMVFALLFVLSEQVSAIPGYTITDLSTLGGDRSLARGINNSTQVVGESYFAPASATQHPFLWENGVMTDLGTLTEQDFASAGAYAINNEGIAAGFSWISGEYHATLWEGDNKTDLSTLGGHVSYAHGINEANQVVGMSYTTIMPNQPEGAFLWENGEMTYLGTHGGEITMTNIGSSANAINNSGQIVGRASYDDTTYRHAFLFENGEMADLGALDGRHSEAHDINESGQIVGTSTTGEFWSITNAVLWQDGEIIDLGRLGGVTSVAFGINESRQIVGRSHTGSQISPSEYHAFIWEDGVLSDLNDLIDDDSGWVLHTASDINDNGQIVGWGNIGGEVHAYLLTPILLDTDSDGIPDDEDGCPNSDLSETVVIDGWDSGVENVLLENGCTILDLISECADEAVNHGEFVSAVSHTTNTLKEDGIISGKDKGMIQKGAGKAAIP